MAHHDLLLRLARAAQGEAPDAQPAFDSALERVLEQASAAAAPAPELRAQVHERLQLALAALPAAEAGGASAAAAGSLRASAGRSASGVRPVLPSLWARQGSKLLVLATGVAIGFAWGRAPLWQAQSAAVPLTAVPAASAPAASAPAATAPDGVAAPEPPGVDTAAPPSVSAPGPATAQPEPHTPPRAGDGAAGPEHRSSSSPQAHAAPAGASAGAASLRLVLEQLRKAQLFSRAGEHRRALAALDELDERVPLSVLQEEREVARTLALCDAGREQAATELAARIIQRAPDSAYALSLRESCAGRGQLLQQIRERTSNPLP